MRANRRLIITGIITILIVAFLGAFRLPYYIYKPGTADPLNDIVEVTGGYESEGDMHLVTVRGGQATPLQWMLAKIRPFHQIYPLEEIRPEGVTEEEYFHAQLQMMESSQEASKVVAYQAAEKEIDITYEGVYVMNVIEGMPAEEILETGDQIVKVDGQEIKETSDLINYVTNMEAGESVTLSIVRKDKEIERDLELAPFPDNPDKVGVGISLVTDRSVKVSPEVNVKSGQIGGPSAGLMFSLEIYDQLTESDLTKGYEIAGTGEINYEGQVGRIGGIDKKVVAASEHGADVFFAPNEEGREGSNYQIAKKAAEEIDTNMKVVPVDTFNDALEYLQNLKPQQEA
ncbi:PDZ domain-containing protein [Halobacillus karajensis]|uniref:endopeptidase La n=1 Tax=Halobacillus karajensis TaxID=195088 RepID=A0A024P202_9BACI|nr:SepM family pheromone-processing serine protease [Halobacillus karajensis]CDQ19859.1 Lon protease [Halobacillus karajensis]CDQ22319.1 Lon protease [Halobacillus karajensis]CDQ28160.1 Lon protease [Halobacillus karajensis]SEH70914.1 PDZ domain-containing protein [Halobacillus karajensis]